ncbi:hypothetical protein, partial [Gilliamella sp. BG6]
LSWSVTTYGGSGDITATVNWVYSNTRVTLSGPRADSSQISSSSPGSLARPVLPQTFELVGRDSSGNEVRYGFVLRQWFVHREYKHDSALNQTTWCNSLGYRMPRVRDLTNSNYNNLGATPSSSGNSYMRHIGAGFFTEWGRMYNYTDAGFVDGYYWASGSNRFDVSSQYGNVISPSPSVSGYAVCTAP